MNELNVADILIFVSFISLVFMAMDWAFNLQREQEEDNDDL